MTTQLDTREALFEVMAQITAEREAARPLVEELLSREEPPWDEEIPEQWKTAGFVDELTRGAAGIAEQDPPRSLSFLQLALAIATSIPTEKYPAVVGAQLEGKVWKEIGFVDSYRSAYDKALHDYASAEACFARERVLSHELACVQLRRAGVLACSRRYDEARSLIEVSAKTFDSFKDRRRAAMAELTAAFVHQCRGEFVSACHKYEQLLKKIEGTDDLHTLGTLYNNLGGVYALLGSSSDAVKMLQHARELYASLDIPTDKPDWALARVLLVTGDSEKAASILRRLRNVLMQKGMPEDVGLVGLDLVEALFAMNRPNEARILAEQVITDFGGANLTDQALSALAYLRDLLPTTSEPQETVRHVRAYVEDLRHPAQVFLPLPDED